MRRMLALSVIFATLSLTSSPVLSQEEKPAPAVSETQEAAPTRQEKVEAAVPPDAARTARPEEAKTYTVVKGDTLWGISRRFMSDAKKWPVLWSKNPEIKNPDLIHPGDVVRIHPDGTIEVVSRKEAAPVKELKKAEEVPPPAPAPEVEKPAPAPVVEARKERPEDLPVVGMEPEGVVVLEPDVEKAAPAETAKAEDTTAKVYRVMERHGFVSSKKLEESGAILSHKEKRQYASKGDMVYISMKKGESVSPGDRYSIFVVGKEVIHPETEEKIGNIIDILGSITITGAGKVIEGQIDRTFKEVPIGARIKTLDAISVKVEPSETTARVTGYVVAGLENRTNLSVGDAVYIDKGLLDGLENGNTLRIFRPSKTVEDPFRKEKATLPPVELGKLMVIEAGDDTSACVITEALSVIYVGDKVSTARAEQ